MRHCQAIPGEGKGAGNGKAPLVFELMHCMLQDAIVSIKAMRSIKRRRSQQAGAALMLFGAIAIKINPAADAARVMKERLVF
jgi:cytochrome c biogenesis protein ResB